MNILADDDRFFCDHPKRTYRCRLATSAELDACRKMGWFDHAVLAPGTYVHAIVRRNPSSNGTRAYLIALKPGEYDEDACAAEWFHAEMAGGHCK